MQQPQDDLQTRWWNLEAKLVERFGKKPDMEAILFLIGIQEFGDIRRKFSKEQKQDLMHIAVCSLFRQSGYYELEGVDEDGWPHFRQLKALPVMSLYEQENFLKDHVLLYFDGAGGDWQRNESGQTDDRDTTEEDDHGGHDHDDDDHNHNHHHDHDHDDDAHDHDHDHDHDHGHDHS
jgi:hypothetical protein